MEGNMVTDEHSGTDPSSLRSKIVLRLASVSEKAGLSSPLRAILRDKDGQRSSTCSGNTLAA